MALHDNFADLAERLINKNGRAVTVKTVVPAPVDPATPWKTDGTATTTTVSAKAVFLDPEGATTFEELMVKISQGLSVEDRTSIEKAETNAWIPAKSVPNGISIEDTLIDGSTEWAISSVKLIQPGPTAIVYILGISR
ncbi:hypothetical protein LCGC14_0731730 [marine sediment metagenome]|uniref:Virion structural protein n=1 Tax=marine sediment metagenome TaxID=412755 RepID=A0A0F9SUJ6_9ZZZZ